MALVAPSTTRLNTDELQEIEPNIRRDFAHPFSQMVPLRIVLVDSSDSATDIAVVLERAGYLPCIERVSAPRALRLLLRRGDCDLLLLDKSVRRLPIGQILDLARENGREIPCVLLGDDLDDQTMIEAMRAGARDCIDKAHLTRLGPVVARELRDAQRRRTSRTTQESLRESNAILQATQNAAGEGICLVSRDGRVMSYNPFFAQIWQLTANQAQELQEKEKLFYHILSMLRDPDEWLGKIQYLFENTESSSRDEVHLLDGRTFERHSAPAHSADGRNYGRVWSFKDITPHKNYELQLAYQAFHDSVTGLPNRALFLDRLERTLARVRRAANHSAVLFLDLDRFKVVNDSLGHAAGDHLLVETAKRLQSCLRPGDTAARFGGDEFTILLEDVAGISDAINVAERILESIKQPFQLGGQEVVISTSIGIVLAGRDAQSADELLRSADVAMYRAKQKGRAQYAIYDTQMSAQALDRLQMEVDLRRAIKLRQLQLYFQPIIDLQKGRIIGSEALARWNHPTRGLVAPAEFVPLAEEIGMILPIGQWVLREACSWGMAWQEQFGNSLKVLSPCAATTANRSLGDANSRLAPLSMAVNISVKQFNQADLAQEVARVLSETGLPAKSLLLEITESTVMEDAKATVAQLDALKKLDVQLSIDDFGTGYSSLAYLERFPLDALKVDRAFVSRIGQRGERLAIIQAICNLGYALGMSVTAEGIETSAQVAQLRRIGCRAGQGFYFSRPIPADEYTHLLERSPQW